MSHYPLVAELYEVNGAIYRRPPYRGRIDNNNSLPAGGDTADLYDDDNHEEESYAHDDGPICGVEESENAGAPPGLESVKDLVDALPRIDPRVRQVGHPIPKWTASIDVPVNLHALLIGRGFATKKEMEDATRCRLTIPQRGSSETEIRIDSSSGADNVSRCLARIDTIVHNATKKRWQATHFIALRCYHHMMQKRFNEFIAMIMRFEEIHVSMRNDDLFPEHSKLHITIAMLCIQTEQDKEKARAALEEIKEQYKAVRPINMEIHGVDYMNDDPHQVHVLFGKVVIVPGLQEFFDFSRHAFWKSGLMKPGQKEHESVKLHVTVMNSRYAVKDAHEDYDASKDYANRVPFDVADFIDSPCAFADFPFGYQENDMLSICEMGSINPIDGFYKTLMEEKVGDIVIERYKPRVEWEPYVWSPRKESTKRQIERQEREERRQQE